MGDLHLTVTEGVVVCVPCTPLNLTSANPVFSVIGGPRLRA